MRRYTNDDLIEFLDTKKKREVYLGHSEYQILKRELQNWTFLLRASLAALLMVLIPAQRFLPYRWLIAAVLLSVLSVFALRKRKLDTFISIHLSRGWVAYDGEALPEVK